MATSGGKCSTLLHRLAMTAVELPNPEGLGSPQHRQTKVERSGHGPVVKLHVTGANGAPAESVMPVSNRTV